MSRFAKQARLAYLFLEKIVAYNPRKIAQLHFDRRIEGKHLASTQSAPKQQSVRLAG